MKITMKREVRLELPMAREIKTKIGKRRLMSRLKWKTS